MDIKSIIAQSKQKKFLGEGDTAIRAFIDVKVQEMTTQAIEQIVPKLFKDITEEIENEIERLTKDVKKGDKGDTPKVGIDFRQPKDGKPGKDYILTNKDKKDISSMIEVPIVEKIVEKTEVIKPEIKEVAKYETAEQIAEKLNTLEEKVDIKVIKGLATWLKGIKENIREKKGGGMGTPVHESLPLTSATTTVSTSTRIAANGFALWVFYQGQMVARGVGYTVSGQTITLLFTPVDGTYLDIMYIRT